MICQWLVLAVTHPDYHWINEIGNLKNTVETVVNQAVDMFRTDSLNTTDDKNLNVE